MLDALRAASDDMRRQMLNWHRSLICNAPMDRRFFAREGRMAEAFGDWFEARRASPDADGTADGLLRQPAFEELHELNGRIFDLAGRMAAEVAKGHEIKTPHYDALIHQVNRFNEQVSRLQNAFQKAVSEIDPLTGLHNRQIMARDLEREYERAQRTRGDWCVALSDIDHFKSVNDTYGHAAGDLVLAGAAARFLSNLRPYDSIYRYGGEEFLISLPDANTGTANSVLERLRLSLESAAISGPDGADIPVTASFGLARVAFDRPLKETIERADRALYRSKQSGRNRITTWSAALDAGKSAGPEAAATV